MTDPDPRFTLLLENYYQHDMMTVMLAAFALVAVLIGWFMFKSATKPFYRILRDLYLAFVLVSYVATMAGSAYVLYVSV